MPDYVHGGVKGKSMFSNARQHAGKQMLVCVDLKNHFPRVSPRKVYRMFQDQQECSPVVAKILTRLTTLNGGLPQGSPTSVAISNLVTGRLSKRLKHFSKCWGSSFTQYIDDESGLGKDIGEFENLDFPKIIKEIVHILTRIPC